MDGCYEWDISSSPASERWICVDLCLLNSYISMERTMRTRKAPSAAKREMRQGSERRGTIITDCVAHIVPLYFFHARAEVTEFDDGLVQHLLQPGETGSGTDTGQTSIAMLCCFTSDLLSFLRVSTSIWILKRGSDGDGAPMTGHTRA